MKFQPPNPYRVLLALVALAALAGIILYPVFVSAKPASSRTRCLSNVKLMAIALQMYQSDHEDRAPVDSWMDRLATYTKSDERFRCPDVRKGAGYGFNAYLMGKELPL